jgi:hypothetical protein
MNVVVTPSLEKGKSGQYAVCLLVRYDDELFFTPQASRELTDRFHAGYVEMSQKSQQPSTSCVVVIQSKTGASAMGRALFALWREVAENGPGQVIVAGYPTAYQDELDALGIPDLPRFKLVDSKEEALRTL